MHLLTNICLHFQIIFCSLNTAGDAQQRLIKGAHLEFSAVGRIQERSQWTLCGAFEKSEIAKFGPNRFGYKLEWPNADSNSETNSNLCRNLPSGAHFGVSDDQLWNSKFESFWNSTQWKICHFYEFDICQILEFKFQKIFVPLKLKSFVRTSKTFWKTHIWLSNWKFQLFRQLMKFRETSLSKFLFRSLISVRLAIVVPIFVCFAEFYNLSEIAKFDLVCLVNSVYVCRGFLEFFCQKFGGDRQINQFKLPSIAQTAA